MKKLITILALVMMLTLGASAVSADPGGGVEPTSTSTDLIA
jgi:hypothetical protein